MEKKQIVRNGRRIGHPKFNHKLFSFIDLDAMEYLRFALFDGNNKYAAV